MDRARRALSYVNATIYVLSKEDMKCGIRDIITYLGTNLFGYYEKGRYIYLSLGGRERATQL